MAQIADATPRPADATPPACRPLFGPFEASAQRLYRAGVVQPVTAHGVRLLTRLVDARGEVVAREALVSQVPLPASHLNACVAELNVVLAADPAAATPAAYIAEFPQRGYALVGAATRPADHRALPPLRLPDRGTPLVGVAAALDVLAARLDQNRCVTLAGSGGMGKTSLAMELVRRVAGRFDVCVVDLAPVPEPGLVTAALSLALGLPADSRHPAAALRAFSRDRPLLVVLDSCEHVRDAAAATAALVLDASPATRVLATSREPLGLPDEQVHRLAPLGLPTARLTHLDELLAYPASRLFVERAAAFGQHLPLTPSDLPALTEICRRLDGIPLAIELAAARVGSVGLQGLARCLSDQRVLLLGGGRRNAPLRHRRLSALLDWSFQLLAPAQQAALARLSTFRGWFTPEAAVAVLGVLAPDAEAARTLMRELVAKSLVSVDGPDRLRLLDTTRQYAAEKLSPADRHDAAMRHARFVLALLTGAEAAWDRLSRRAWTAEYSPWVADVRVAIDWAFATPGEARLGIELTLGAYGIADHAGLMFEFEGRARQAIAMADTLVPADPVLHARLVSSFPTFLHWNDAPDGRRFNAAGLQRALAVARTTGAVRDQLPALKALWLGSTHAGDYEGAVGWTRSVLQAATTDDDPASLLGRTFHVFSLHFAGHHDEADRLARLVRARSADKLPFAYSPTSVNGAVASGMVQARLLWLRGRSGEALHLARESADLAARDNPFAECQTLCLSVLPILHWRGDTAAAQAEWHRLCDLTTTYGLDYWGVWGRMYALLASDDPRAPADLDALLADDGSLTLLRDHAVTLDPRLLAPAQGARLAARTCGWGGPEVLRAQALLTPSPATAAALLAQSLALAEAQGALAWRLRTANALAQHHQVHGRTRQALAVLAPVHDAVPADEDTADVRLVRRLLRTLASRS